MLHLQILNDSLSILQKAAMHLLNGQVIYTYRQMGYLRVGLENHAALVDRDGQKSRTANLIMARLRKGEQVDAYNEIKSLTDQLESARQNLLTTTESVTNAESSKNQQ